jgi:streptogramin lyase
MTRPVNTPRGTHWPRACLHVERLEPRQLPTASFIASFPVPAAIGSIVTGPDGNVWFTEPNVNRIGIINPTSHAVAEVPLPAGVGHLSGIAVGPDLKVWFADDHGVGVVDPVTRVVVQVVGPAGTSIAAGADGRMWYAAGTSMVAVDPSSRSVVATVDISAYYISTSDYVFDIAAGPDGKLWFNNRETVATIDPMTLVVTTIVSFSGAFDSIELNGTIITGTDRRIWIAGSIYSSNHAYVEIIDPTTHAASSVPVGDKSYYSFGGVTLGLASGPDGKVWVTTEHRSSFYDYTSSYILVTVDPVSLAQTTQTVSDPSRIGSAIAAGPGGTLWTASVSDPFSTQRPPSIDEIRLVPDHSVGGTITLDSGGGAVPVAGRAVYLDLNGNGRPDPGEPATLTDAFGQYLLTAPADGTYTVRAAYPNEGIAGVLVTLARDLSNSVDDFAYADVQLVRGSAILPPVYIPVPLYFGSGFYYFTDSGTRAKLLGALAVIGRADYVTFTAWYDKLRAGATLTQFAQVQYRSTTYESSLVSSYYLNDLGRTGTADEVATWVARMQAGMSEERVAALFLASDEFARSHADPGSFLRALYVDVLGRPSKGREVADWELRMASGMTRTEVIDRFIHSDEAERLAIQGDYTTFFGRPPDAAGFDAALVALRGGMRLDDIAAYFIGTQEFQARALQIVKIQTPYDA